MSKEKSFFLFYTKNIFSDEDINTIGDIIREVMRGTGGWRILPYEYIEKVEFVTTKDSKEKMWFLLEKIRGAIPFEVKLNG